MVDAKTIIEGVVHADLMEKHDVTVLVTELRNIYPRFLLDDLRGHRVRITIEDLGEADRKSARRKKS